MAPNAADKCISAAALDALLTAHDGDVALLYLYLLDRPEADPEQAAGELYRTLREVSAAWEKLERMGLLPVGGGAVRAGAPAEKAEPPLPPAEELPQYTAAEIARHKQDGTFSAVLDEAAKVMGRNLSGNDMRVLFGVYDHLGLPGEVLMELLNYLGEVYRERYGEGRRPTAHAIETEAYVWARQELLTFEQAEEYIRAQKRRFGELSRLQTQLDIRGRGLGKTERRYLNEWLDLGFEEEAIALAYDRTLTATGKLSWPYMNGILRSWHQQGLHGAREIEEKDGRGRRKGPARKADEPVDLEALQRAVDKI